MAFLPRRQSADPVWAAGDLGGSVDRNGITDCDSVRNTQQNQVAKRGTVHCVSSSCFFCVRALVPIL
jgi:hypothetical protein